MLYGDCCGSLFVGVANKEYDDDAPMFVFIWDLVVGGAHSSGAPVATSIAPPTPLTAGSGVILRYWEHTLGPSI